MNIVIFTVEACLILTPVAVIAWRQVRGQHEDEAHRRGCRPELTRRR